MRAVLADREMMTQLVMVAGGAVLDDREGELLQLGEQVAQLPGIVEQGLPGGELLGGEPPGDGLAADLAGPLGVRAVQLRRVGVAAAAGLAAGVGADGEGACGARLLNLAWADFPAGIIAE